MELARLPMTGRPVRLQWDGRSGPVPGVLGIDVDGRGVDGREVDGADHTVVQLLLDDDAAGFDRSLLDDLVVAEVVADGGARVVAREPFDHDAFRRRLQAERDAGESTTRGVLVLTGGELPPPWVRLAFLPVALGRTAGCELVVRRTTPAELVAGVEEAHALGRLTDQERSGILTTVEQRLPDRP